MKRFKIICLTFIILISSFSIFGCNNTNINKSEWNEAFKVIYRIHSSYGGYIETDQYCLVTEEFYNQCLDSYHSENSLDWNAKLKKMYVKLEDFTCYVKLISWSDKEEIKTHNRNEISWIDYL